MFKNEFQGGNFFEILNPSFKEPLANFKLTGSHGIQKIFDKEVKGSVYQLDGIPTTTKITLPKDSKQSLSLIQRIIVFQVNIKQSQDFSLEISITDLSQNRRNLSFSTSHKELNIQPLSARIPFKSLNRAIWTNLVFDLSSLINQIWKNQTFKSIDSLSICANCKLRKIFTIKNLPIADFGLSIDDSLSQVEFPQGTESRLHIFSINDSKSNESSESTLNAELPSLANHKTKTNTFKIAFGTKISRANSASSNNLNQANKNLSKISNSQPHIPNETTDVLSLSLKNTQISPLSMSNGLTSSNDLRTARKSMSDHQLSDKSNSQEISTVRKSQESQPSSRTTTWNQRAANKPSTLSKLNSTSTLTSKQTSKLESQAKSPDNFLNGNKISGLIQTKIIPHPPPQSTRPSSSSIRKKRLPTTKLNKNVNTNLPTSEQSNSNSLLKLTNFADSSNEDELNNSSKNLTEFSDKPKNSSRLIPTAQTYNKSNYTTTNESNTNESLDDVIQALKLNQLHQNKFNSKTTNVNLKFSEITNLDDSSNTITYSFSSKPKAVIMPKLSNINTDTINNNQLVTSSNLTSNLLPIESKSNSYDHRKYTSKSKLTNQNLLSFAKDSLNQSESYETKHQTNLIHQTNNYESLMDSFEAKMLQNMKAEMESNNYGIESKTSATNSASSTKSTKQETKQEVIQTRTKSPDVDFIEKMQRESSGVLSPCSDDNNNTTSEKYNFDAMTSSIDETTTSISKKTVNRKTKIEDVNIYQDEMNISLQTNLPTKSINLKDLPLKYSPSLNQQNKVQKSPITEEPPQYDDSQADIDEIISDSDEEIDLLYDPALNCYYDPKTFTYYELNLS